MDAQTITKQIADIIQRSAIEYGNDSPKDRGDAEAVASSIFDFLDQRKIALNPGDAWKMQEQYAGKPHGWVQWQGTEVCMDIYCECGHHSHVDASFTFNVKCPVCNRIYFVNGHIELIEVSNLDNEMFVVADTDNIYPEDNNPPVLDGLEQKRLEKQKEAQMFLTERLEIHSLLGVINEQSTLSEQESQDLAIKIRNFVAGDHDIPPSPIKRVLNISQTHLSIDLRNNFLPMFPWAGYERAEYPKRGVWVIKVPTAEEVEKNGPPAQLIKVLDYARSRNCTWVRLSPTAMVSEDLPVFDS